MPSQISLRPPSGLPGSAVKFNKVVLPNYCASISHDIEAAAAPGMVATPLTSNKSIRKPQPMVSGQSNSCGSLEQATGTLRCALKPLFNPSCTSKAPDVSCKEHSNGIAVVTPPEGMQEPHQTKGEHSNDHGSLTDQPNSSRLMCPDLAISYTGTLVNKRAGYLATKQKTLENKVASLQNRVRRRQLEVVHSHASRQLSFIQSHQEEGHMSESGSASTLTGSECSMDLSPPHPEILPLPIQVDGASDDAFLPDEGGREAEVRRRGEDSFSSLESFVSSVASEDGGGDEGDTIGVQLETLERLMDADVTDESSDEEETKSGTVHNQK